MRAPVQPIAGTRRALMRSGVASDSLGKVIYQGGIKDGSVVERKEGHFGDSMCQMRIGGGSTCVISLHLVRLLILAAAVFGIPAPEVRVWCDTVYLRIVLMHELSDGSRCRCHRTRFPPSARMLLRDHVECRDFARHLHFTRIDSYHVLLVERALRISCLIYRLATAPCLDCLFHCVLAFYILDEHTSIQYYGVKSAVKLFNTRSGDLHASYASRLNYLGL